MFYGNDGWQCMCCLMLLLCWDICSCLSEEKYGIVSFLIMMRQAH